MGYYYSSVSGHHKGCLVGPTSGADFDLYPERWNGSARVIVARSESATSSETISYFGPAACYRWQVYSYSGAGNYTLWTLRP